MLGYHQASRTDGLFWGMDAVRRSPLFFDLFANDQAAHMVILGKSGSGKTFFLNLLALRGAALAGYRVIGIDAFRNGERVAAAARAGARCFFLGLETPINILDGSRLVAKTWSAHVQDERSLAENWTLNVGLRGDRYQLVRSESQLSPRLGLVWQASDGTTVHAGYSRYFTPPATEMIASFNASLPRRGRRARASPLPRRRRARTPRRADRRGSRPRPSRARRRRSGARAG